MRQLRSLVALAIVLAGCAHRLPDRRTPTYAVFDLVTADGYHSQSGPRVWIESSGWWVAWLKYVTVPPSLWAHGTWHRSGRWLVLSEAFEADRRWLYVGVGDDAYLVPESKLASFCAARTSRLRRISGSLRFAPLDADKACANL